MQLLNTCKIILSKIIDLTGIYDYRIKSFNLENNNRSWLILMYHRVISDHTQDPFNLGMCVSSNVFEEQLIYLKSHYKIIKLSDMINAYNSGIKIDEKTLSITFDDGYYDNLKVALPLLQKHSIPATIFVSTGGLEENKMFWWDRLINAFENTDKSTLNLSNININASNILSLNRFQIKKSLIRLQDILWKHTIPEIQEVIVEIERELEVSNTKQSLRLTRQQIQQLHEAGIEIGAHTVSHPNLTLVSESEIVKELKHCKHELESIINAPVNGFAFPGGRGNERIRTLIAEAGYDYAVSTDKGVNFDDTDKFCLLRIGMPNTSISDFKRCLSSIIQSTT